MGTIRHLSSTALLRALIREELNHAQLDLLEVRESPTAESDLALIARAGQPSFFVLYDPKEVRALIEEATKAFDEEDARRVEQEKKLGPAKPATPKARHLAIRERTKAMIRDQNWINRIIVGMIKAVHPSSTKQPNWGAGVVEKTAARKGWGPFMYDVAMAVLGGLTPDRRFVSPSANNIWSRYKNDRPDVTAKPLDDANRPRTPSTEDDSSFMHPESGDPGDVPQNPLNYAYFIESGPDIARLEANHKAIEGDLAKYAIAIEAMSQWFFGMKYNA